MSMATAFHKVKQAVATKVSEPTAPLSDAPAFFASAKKVTGGLNQVQVDTINAIMQECKHWPRPWVAYALATAWHECRLAPIKEWGSVSYLSKYDTGRLARMLGNTPEADGDGVKYAGRGLVQLTGLANYRKAGEFLKLDLVSNPDLALEPRNAARILSWGMETGAFTGKALRHYISGNGSYESFRAARRIINGTDKAELIAGHALKFRDALAAGGWA